MTYEARRNTIVSHGGKQGVGGTYLKGQQIAPEVARELPADLVAHDPTLAEAPAPAAAPVAPTASTPAAVPPSAAPPVTPAAARTGTLPQSVRELYALKKEELVKLASDLGVVIEGEQTVNALREALKTGLGL